MMCDGEKSTQEFIDQAYDRWSKENEGCGESFTWEDMFEFGYREALRDTEGSKGEK